MEEVLNATIGHEIYYFLEGFLGYHHMIIVLVDRYKTTFIID
jgi:hypothetical protein